MKKNVSGQVIGAQCITASDGSAFTGSVTCYVTGDGGTQAVGSVSSGACAHEGNGFQTYAPAQAETNYDHIGYTFIGTGMIPATIQVYTTFPQTGDSYARLGAPAGASVSADIAVVDENVDSVLVDTAEIGAAGVGLTALASASNLATVDTVVDGIQTDLSNGTDGLGAIKTAVDALPTATENADALLNRDMSAVSDTNARSPLNALRFLRNKWSVAGTTLTVTEEDDTTAAWTATVTADSGADPITGSDPA